jgi:hypothetical protein
MRPRSHGTARISNMPEQPSTTSGWLCLPEVVEFPDALRSHVIATHGVYVETTHTLKRLQLIHRMLHERPDDYERGICWPHRHDRFDARPLPQWSW